MATSRIEYLGGLRTECRHLASGTVIKTDAPLDNKGKGEFFSPTDLVATAYGSCMLTIMGIFCEEHGISMSHGTVEITKVMAANPRRIGKIVLHIDLSANNWDESTADRVIRAGKACPVAKTIDENVEIEFDIRS
jgi:putative redox protein